MKKLLSLVICLIGLTSLNVAAESKVTVYVFRGHDCPHCFDALKYFYNNRDKADYEVKSIEVWKNENNKPFYNAVLDHFSEEDGGVPYIVIGNNYHAAGYADSMIMDITNSIKQAQKDENYSDVIENLLKDYPDVKVDSLSDAALEEGVYYKSSLTDYIIVFSIFLVVIGGGLIIVKASRK